MFGSYFRTLAAILVSDFVLVSAAKKPNKNLAAPQEQKGKKERKGKRD